MKTAFAIIGAIIVIALFGTMMVGMREAQTDDREEDHIVATGVGETEADVVLVLPLYGNALGNVVSIESDLGTDVPLATDYTALTRTLEVSGLTANDSRTLTITFRIAALEDYAGVNEFFGFIPLLVGVGIVAIIIGAGWAAFRNR